MRKIFSFLLILVIVLVSLNWFRVAKAQDVSSLTEEQKQAITKAIQKKAPIPEEQGKYKTPDAFSHEQGKTQQHQSTLSQAPDTLDSTVRFLGTTKTDKDKLPEFSELKPFGMELFSGTEETAPPVDMAAASDYLLGPGDNVLIYVWGRAEKEFDLTIDREGKIFIPRLGEIVAWGLTVEQFTEKVKHQLSKTYAESDVTVSLGKIRTIRVYVTGEVKRPGAYTVTSLTSLFNAIYVAGGPNERGSMRSIRLMRNGQLKSEIDLYQLLLHGDNSTDARLETGDVVFVPVSEMRVAIRGEVKRPAIYELKGEECVLDLISLAGQPTPEAYLERVMLERVSNQKEWTVRDLKLDSVSSSLPDNNVAMQDGDRVTVYSIFDMRKQMVSVFGMVQHPGVYERTDSTRIRDLLLRAQLQPYDVYYERADLFRIHTDRRMQVIPVDLTAALQGDVVQNYLLSDRDSLHVYSIVDIRRDKFVTVEGEVERPGRYPMYDGMTTLDLIFLAGSFTRAADQSFAELARLDSLGNVRLMQLMMTDTTQRITLQAEDQLYIRRIAEWETDRIVSLEGEFTYPGQYTLSSQNETLYQLLQRAGGFTANAFPAGLVLTRKSISKSLERAQITEMMKRSQTLVRDTLGKIQQEELFNLNLNSMERIILDVNRLVKTGGQEGNIVMQPGDQLYVPAIPSGIPVMGAVSSNGTIQHIPGKKVKFYVERAGDFTRQSDKKQTRLIRASGEVLSGSSVLNRKVLLGDVIVVPTRIEKDHNWLKTVTTALGAATGVLTSVYIISNL